MLFNNCSCGYKVLRTVPNNDCFLHRSLMQDKFVSEVLMEIEDDEKFHKRELHEARIHPIIVEQKRVNAISKEMAEITHKELWEQSKELQLEKNSLDIRNLKRELQTAEMLFEVKKMNAIKENTAVENLKQQRIESYARERHNREEAAAREMELVKRKEAFRKEQLEQLRESEQRKQQLMNEKLKAMEKIKTRERRIAEMILEEKRQLIIENQKLVKECNAEIEKYQNKQRNRKINRFSNMSNIDHTYENTLLEREAERKRRIKESVDRRLNIGEKIGMKAYETEKNLKVEVDEYIELLWHEENVKQQQNERNELNKMQITSNQLWSENARFQEQKKILKETEKQRRKTTAENTQRMVAKQREEDKRESDIRFRKNRECYEEGMKLKEMQRCLRAQDAENNKKIIAQIEAQERDEEERIKELRLRLLKQKPIELLQFLGPKILYPHEKEYFKLNKVNHEPGRS